MPVFRIDDRGVTIRCANCNEDYVAALRACRLEKDQVVFPNCPGCGARLISVCVEMDMAGADKVAVERQRIIRSVHARLVARGQDPGWALPEWIHQGASLHGILEAHPHKFSFKK
jgi:hypothetical protein